VVDVPRTLYAKSDDTYLAYQVLGDGPLDVVLLSEGFISIDSVDEEPSLARFHRRLASFSRLVRFDRRGVGLSDPVSPSNPPTLEQMMHDALAVMDAAGVARAAVLSWASAKPAVMLAVAHPHRVSSLVVVNGFARTLSAPDYPAGWSPEEQEIFDVSFQPDAVERGVDVLAMVAPSVAHDEAFRAWWDRAGNRGASPAMARAITEMSRQVDVRSLLESIQVPTLVLHRRDDRYIRVGHGRYLAERIPDAKYVELEGADHLPFQGDTDVMLDEIEEFLTGVRHGLESDRSLAAVLFTDIIGSTERIAELGETRWRDLLDRHDAALRRQLQRFRGREIKTTGDGFLATFDGPARGVQCACAIRDAASQLGLAVRAGIHVGEVELRGPDIAGMTVHVTARIQALADPGEVLVSRTVVDLLAGSAITFTDRGEHELRGVPGTWRLFRVTEA